MKAYSHSRAFEILKGTQEAITGNLTSLQYLQTLDFFLWNALLPIQIECPSLFNNYLAKITAQQTLKASTKFTSDDRARLPIHLFNTLTATDFKKSHEHSRSMHINRGLLFGFLSMFLNRLRYYEKLHSPLIEVDITFRRSELYRIENSMGVRPGTSLYCVIQQVRHWYDKARDFKEKIMQKYTRMAILHAQGTYKDYNHFVHLDDCVQTYLLIVSRAIDRCDARQGVLTTFIQNWFKSARSEIANLAKGQTDQSIESLNEDHGDAVSEILGFVLPDTRGEVLEHVSYIAKLVDPNGYIRASMEIPEFLTREQKAILQTFVLEN